jgi:hypothetical protein
MASFEFRVPVLPIERRFARLLLNYLQRLALARQCSRPTVLRFRWCNPTKEVPYRNYRVSVDGDFVEIQAFCSDANTALYHFGEGIIALDKSHRRRTRLHQVVAIAFIKALYEFNDDFVDFARQMHGSGIPIVPNSYIFGRVHDGNLNWLMGALTVALMAWRNAKATPEAVAEQLHTTLEGLLRKAHGEPSRGKTFNQLVGAALSADIISTEEEQSILRLNILRRNAKHRRQRIPARKLEVEIGHAVSACHKLVSWLSPQPQDNNSLQRRAASSAR